MNDLIYLFKTVAFGYLDGRLTRTFSTNEIYYSIILLLIIIPIIIIILMNGNFLPSLSNLQLDVVIDILSMFLKLNLY